MKKDYKVFPEVPEVFHDGLEAALAQVQEEWPKEKQRRKKRRVRLPLVLAATLAIGATAVAAAELFTWHPKVAEEFQTEEAQQEELTVIGVASEAPASCTEAGVTVNALQTLQDGHYLYVALEVIAPEEVVLNSDNAFEEVELEIEGLEFGANGTASKTYSFMDERMEPELSNRRIYELYYYESAGFTLDGKTITVKLKNLQAPVSKLEFENAVNGEWELSWVNRSQDSTRHYEINQAFDFSGHEIMVKSVDVSPLSMKILYDGADVKRAEESEGVSFAQLDTLFPIRFAGVRMKDGTVNENVNAGSGSEGYSEDGTSFKTTGMYGCTIDLDQVECLLFGPYEGPYTEIPLPASSEK